MPPAVTSLNVIAAPAHTLSRPVIVPAFGSAFTVTRWVATTEFDPEVTVYFTVSVPADVPVTTPDALTVAKPNTVLQVPPGVPVGSVSVMDAATHTLSAPIIVPATMLGITVTV